MTNIVFTVQSWELFLSFAFLYRNITRDKMTYSLHSNLHHLVMNNARGKDTFLFNGQDTIYLSLSMYTHYYIYVTTRKEKDMIVTRHHHKTFVMSI